LVGLKGADCGSGRDEAAIVFGMETSKRVFHSRLDVEVVECDVVRAGNDDEVKKVQLE